MPVVANDIGWGGYDKYTGPFFGGRIKYSLPLQPDFMDKALGAVTSTEGGTYDAVNMYDRCVVSVGLIQWCEAGQYSVSTLLGRCAELDQFMFDTQIRKFPVSIGFMRNDRGLYRFFHKGEEVNSLEKQHALFFNGSDGEPDNWNPENKAHAKSVAAWFANFWEYPLFQRTQAEYTKLKLPAFILSDARELIFKDGRPAAQFSWMGALRAAYYSFAANLPSVANRSILAASKEWDPNSEEDMCRVGLKFMTLSPDIKIYPIRYGKLAPYLNKTFGVSLPVKPEELEAVTPIPLTDVELAAYQRYMKVSTDLAQGVDGLDAISRVLGE